MEIYGTIGPACEQVRQLEEMFRLGMTGIRLNASHSSLESADAWIKNIRQAAEAAGVNPQLLIDLQGPELRIRLAGEMHLTEGEKELLRSAAQEKEVYSDHADENAVYEKEIGIPDELAAVFTAQMELLLNDGKILLQTDQKVTDGYLCKVLRGGILSSGKSIAIKDQRIALPTLTAADIQNIKAAKAYGVTGVMLPFVRGKKDLDALKQALKESECESLKIYAKIENREGIQALDEIIEGCDMVVIARGDLGNAVPLWELPVVQHQIEERCKKKNRKFMVVTQMLASMEYEKVPTRAEVSDVFRAVSEGADAIMLTGETAAGNYPVAAMEYFVKTADCALKYFT